MVADARPVDHEQDEGAGSNGAIEILDQNVDACRVFFGMVSQWRAAPMVIGARALIVRTALDYAALPVVAAAHGVTLDAALLGKLQILEDEAVRAMAEAM